MQLAEGQDAYQLLAAPWNDLWLHWLDEGNNAYKQQVQDSSQQRLEFVQSVVAAALKKSSEASQTGDAAESQAETGVPEQAAQKVRGPVCTCMTPAGSQAGTSA